MPTACAAPATCVPLRLLPQRQEQPHKKMSATERADAAAAGNAAPEKRGWRSKLPWNRSKAAAPPPPAAAAPAENGVNGKPSSKDGSGASAPAITVTDVELQQNGRAA